MTDLKNFTSKAIKSFEKAIEYAEKCFTGVVGSEHILLGIMCSGGNAAALMLQKQGLSEEKILRSLDKIYPEKSAEIRKLSYDKFSFALKKILAVAEEISIEKEMKLIGTEHILTAIAMDKTCVAYRILRENHINIEGVKVKKRAVVVAREVKREVKFNGLDAKQYPNLAKYGENLNEKTVDPVIGREPEIERLIQILSRRMKNNACLIGEPGVGKTALVEGVAKRISEGKVPPILKGKLIYSLNLTSMVAGTAYRGDFEKRIDDCIKEVLHAGNVILFIDEFHTIMGAGSAEGASGAADILKPLLSRGSLQIIGATTIKEYRKYIETDGAFERRFQNILLEEPNEEQAFTILKGLKTNYEKFHKVKLNDNVLKSAVKYSVRYITNRFLPDKAIDIIDEACVRAKNGKVTEEDIINVVSSLAKVPVKKLSEKSDFEQIENILKKRVKGQNEAINVLLQEVKMGRLGLSDSRRPMGSFLFAGGTGVGKTECAKALAEGLFGSEDSLIRIDMSEYSEQYTVSRLIGSAPGYVGSDKGGVLTEAVRTKPYSVVLFDEIEKAHKDVLNLLLQVLDEGVLTDAKGVKVNFKNTFIILTSNLGANSLNNSVGFANNSETSKSSFTREISKILGAEFVNRLDNIVVFKKLSKESLAEISENLLEDLVARAKETGVKLKIEKGVAEWIADCKETAEFGARPLKRRIRTEIENKLAAELINNNRCKSFGVDVENSGIVLKSLKEKFLIKS